MSLWIKASSLFSKVVDIFILFKPSIELEKELVDSEIVLGKKVDFEIDFCSLDLGFLLILELSAGFLEIVRAFGGDLIGSS